MYVIKLLLLPSYIQEDTKTRREIGKLEAEVEKQSSRSIDLSKFSRSTNLNDDVIEYLADFLAAHLLLSSATGDEDSLYVPHHKNSNSNKLTLSHFLLRLSG